MRLVKSDDDVSIFHRRESEVRSYCRRFDSVFEKGQGSVVTSAEGRVYIDFLAGCSSLNYGHNDPDMKRALIDHISQDGLAHGLDLFTTAKRAFLETFEAIILAPRGMEHRVQFTGPTGANAVEAALKLARKVTGRTNVIAFTNGYHGVTLGALATTGSRYHRMGTEMPLGGVSRLPFDGYLDAFDTAAMLDKMLSDPSGGLDEPAAILLETVQGEGGLNAASPAWVRRIAEIAKRHGALLIIDEIQAGCGRTGPFFSFEDMGIVPDLITLSKSVSGFGLPMSMVLIKPEFDVWSPGEHNGTFRGNTHAFVTARVMLRKFWADEKFRLQTDQKACLLTSRLAEIAAQIPGARLKGRGMMQGIDVGSGALAAMICRLCFDDGLIVETAGPNDEVVKILAPLTTPRELLESGLDIVSNAVMASLSVGRSAAE